MGLMHCRVCDSSKLALAIDLGVQPWANHFLSRDEVGREPKYPLRVVYCNDCATAQLDFTVRKEVMFADHTYLSGVTRSLSDHFLTIAREGKERFCAGEERPAVLDIGSNDGTQLKHFQALGCEVLGVESSKRIAGIANGAGIPTANAFFNLEFAQGLGRRFHLINAAGVFFHLEELHSAAEGIRALLRPDGVFMVQFLYMKRIIENCAFDQIYHEHLLYYNLKTIETLLLRHGLSMFDAYLSPIHGGSIMGFVSHTGQRVKSDRLQRLLEQEEAARANEFDTYVRFGERILRMKESDLAFLGGRKRDGKRIYGLGAPVKGNTLLNFFGIGTQYLDCLVERNALRRGLYSPGMHIPVLIEDEIGSAPDVYYVLAWNFKREILERYRDLIAVGVEFYFPVDPEPVSS